MRVKISGKWKRKAETETELEIGNGKAEIEKWSSIFVVLMPFAHARSLWSWHCQCCIYQLSLTTDTWLDLSLRIRLY